MVSGRTEEELAEAAAAVKATIAFYGSTPAYRPVLELHGWEALADELHALSVGRREDKWTAMRDLVDDEVLATFAVVAEPDDVGRGGPAPVRRAGRPVQRLRLLPGAAGPVGPAGRRVPLTPRGRRRGVGAYCYWESSSVS